MIVRRDASEAQHLAGVAGAPGDAEQRPGRRLVERHAGRTTRVTHEEL